MLVDMFQSRTLEVPGGVRSAICVCNPILPIVEKSGQRYLQYPHSKGEQYFPAIA
jgi:hypothetical protein